jgi:hypothetical protein
MTIPSFLGIAAFPTAPAGSVPESGPIAFAAMPERAGSFCLSVRFAL